MTRSYAAPLTRAKRTSVILHSGVRDESLPPALPHNKSMEVYFKRTEEHHLGIILANSIIVLFVLLAVFFFFFFFSSSGACSLPVSFRILSLVWARLALTPVPCTFLYIVCRRRKKSCISERHATTHCSTWLVHSQAQTLVRVSLRGYDRNPFKWY